MTPEQRIDAALDSVLRASGSALKHYTMPSTLDAMRAAMRDVMSASYIAGSGAAIKASQPSNLKRVGWMTYDLGGNTMFFGNEEEAALYCDDDEEPIPIYMVAQDEPI